MRPELMSGTRNKITLAFDFTNDATCHTRQNCAMVNSLLNQYYKTA
jgi:hypothetical protein